MSDEQSTDEQKRALVMKGTLYLAGSQSPELLDQYRFYVQNAPQKWIDDTYLQMTEDAQRK